MILVRPCWTASTSLGGEVPAQSATMKCESHTHTVCIIPSNVMSAESEKALLATVHVYSPAAVTVRVCVYCAISGSSNTVSVPSVTVVVESLVQVTVVAGPPVEIQVRVNWGLSPLRSEVRSTVDIVI